MESYEFIEGHERVIERFGKWPSFHDGEVHRVVFDRTPESSSGNGRSAPSIELDIRGWIMRPRDDGSYELGFDSVVTFRFEDVFDVRLEGFNHQNLIYSFALTVEAKASMPRPFLRVSLEHCYEFSATFAAQGAKVLDVVRLPRQ